MTPTSYLSALPVKLADASVSIAVVPPSAISIPVAVANMYANAAVASAVSESRPTIRTESA